MREIIRVVLSGVFEDIDTGRFTLRGPEVVSNMWACLASVFSFYPPREKLGATILFPP